MTWELDADSRLVVKLQTRGVEVNVTGDVAEFLSLAGIRDANWAHRSVIRAGSVAGRPAFWCYADSAATILIGGDDETWDVAVAVPVHVVDQVAAAARELEH